MNINSDYGIGKNTPILLQRDELIVGLELEVEDVQDCYALDLVNITEDGSLRNNGRYFRCYQAV
jgi:hypothetical protein